MRYSERFESKRFDPSSASHTALPTARTAAAVTASATTTRSPRVTAWRTAVFAIFATNGLGISAVISRTPTIRDELHITVAEVGVLIVAASIGAIVGLLLSSHIVHWLGGRRTIAITLSACGIGVAGIGLGAALGSYAVAWISLLVYGAASSICDVGMNVEGAGVERASGTAIMPWFHAAWSLGGVISAGLGSIAAFAGIPPVVHFAVIGAIIVASAIVATRFIPRVDPDAADEPRLTFRERMSVWLEPRTLLIGVVMLGMAFAEGSANDWLALGVHDDRHFNDGQAALAFGTFATAMTVGRILGVPLINRLGRVVSLRAAAIAALLGLALVILVPVPAVTYIAIAVWGLGASLGFPVGISAAGDEPAKAAARVSVVATLAYGAFLVGPPVIGFVGQHVGVLNALWIVFGLIVIAALAIPAARPPRAPDDADPGT
ncbi:MFS transporter [Pseudolysinimonas kribbensis]|uniref:MFS transporter n=1 Tax=Pseudolysinimonas kribbensis TaxID=433641 RepID=UPI0031D00F3B